MSVLQELEDRLRIVDQQKEQLKAEQKIHSQKASEIQKSLINLDGQEIALKQLVTVINSKHL